MVVLNTESLRGERYQTLLHYACAREETLAHVCVTALHPCLRHEGT